MKIKDHPTIVWASAVVISQGTKPHRVVLRHVPESHDPWVTHMENLKIVDAETLEHESFYWGHYFEEKEHAEADFHARLKGT